MDARKFLDIVFIFSVLLEVKGNFEFLKPHAEQWREKKIDEKSISEHYIKIA